MRRFKVTVNGDRYTVWVAKDRGQRHALPDVQAVRADARVHRAEPRVVTAPLPGRILAVRVAAGDHVQAGQLLVVLEAMKMENELAAEAPCLVAEILVQPGDVVALHQTLLTLA